MLSAADKEINAGVAFFQPLGRLSFLTGRARERLVRKSVTRVIRFHVLIILT